MKANITINFKRVSGHNVDDKMSNDPQFRASVENTTKKLCEQIEKYFHDFKIKVRTTFQLE